MKDTIQELINYKREIQLLFEEMGELEYDLVGMEFEYFGDYASVMYADGNSQNVCIYVEDEDGESSEHILSLSELMNLI